MHAIQVLQLIILTQICIFVMHFISIKCDSTWSCLVPSFWWLHVCLSLIWPIFEHIGVHEVVLEALSMALWDLELLLLPCKALSYLLMTLECLDEDLSCFWAIIDRNFLCRSTFCHILGYNNHCLFLAKMSVGIVGMSVNIFPSILDMFWSFVI